MRASDGNRSFDLSRLVWWRVMVAGSLFFTAWTAITPSLPDTEFFGVFKQTFNLGLELNLAVWWSSMLFFCGAGLAYRLARTPGEDTFAWGSLAAVLTLLSLDEMGSLHERANEQWFFPVVGLVAVVSVLSLARLVLTGRRGAAGLIAVAFALFAMASQILEEIDTLRGGAVVGAVRGLEEGTELLGIGLIILAAVMTLTDPHTAPLSDVIPRIDDRASRAALLAVLAIGLVVSAGYVPADGRGDPGRWFVAAGFLAVAGTILVDRSAGGRPGLASLVAVAVSIDACYHLYDVPGAEHVMPEAAQHISGLLLLVALWILARKRLRSAAWSAAALALPVLALGVLSVSDTHRLHHTLALCIAAVWVVGLATPSGRREISAQVPGDVAVAAEDGTTSAPVSASPVPEVALGLHRGTGDHPQPAAAPTGRPRSRRRFRWAMHH